ncbi:HAD-IIB family hydrolase [Candidatus Chlamydia sanziniae]|uniref:HAD superfamily hydrolase/phosphatase n=1 Tax=Candidatus Chlamydia sanziniae TaxID=1806891 RepID=A0A1A9HVW5_9CHLA|nr:HAD family hydrolase [Candidatus Chlamydia sanziniae]ANH79139.1 HAD superfamily hydrolase/phosphatase [Candidatus Chlamydia sanziniae]
MKKLLATDIDGTITHQSHEIHSEVIAALYSLHASGWDIFFLTGRYYRYAIKLFKKLSIPFLLGCQNGASTWSSASQCLLYSQGISSEYLTCLQEGLEDALALLTVESGMLYGDECYRFSPTPTAKLLHQYIDPRYFPNAEERKILKETRSLKTDYPYPSFVAAKVFGKKEEVIRIQKEFQKNDLFMSCMTMTLMRWPFDFQYAILFFTDRSISKGQAIDRIVDLLYYGNRPFIMTSGDDANDIDLIQRGDFKIVMSSSPKDMHKYADFLAPPAKEKGILSAWAAGVNYYEKIMGF